MKRRIPIRRHRIGAPITTLPGGARLSFGSYLPHRTCARCQQHLTAAQFLKDWAIIDGRRTFNFGETCLQCVPPDRAFPADLNGARFSNTYTDNQNRIVTWREHARQLATSRELPLSMARLRQTADGVYRLQPKIDRRSYAKQHARSQAMSRTIEPNVDPRRCFTREDVDNARRRQRNVCPICKKPFTKDNPAVGGHSQAWAKGYRTISTNCVALHASCNSLMGTGTLLAARRRYMALFQTSLLALDNTEIPT